MLSTTVMVISQGLRGKPWFPKFWRVKRDGRPNNGLIRNGLRKLKSFGCFGVLTSNRQVAAG
jgi:hypothetical protein